MKPNDQQSLPDCLNYFRLEAEKFFDTSFSDVKISVSPEPGIFKALAYTFGKEIYFSPEVVKLPKLDIYELLIHELTHVVQQSQGRVLPNTVWNGRLGNNDPGFENEARQTGRSWRDGEPCSMQNRGSNFIKNPVIQKSILLDDRLLSSKDNLTVKARNILELISDGEAWLNWAISEQNTLYPFTNESELLKGIQSGNHGESILLLKKINLLIAPLKLMELDNEDFSRLYYFESKDNFAPSDELKKNISDILSKYGLLDQSQLTKKNSLLESLGVNDDPLFQSLDLSEKIALIELYKHFEQTEIQSRKNAASFALEQAPTSLAFLDYILFYNAIIKKQKTDKKEIPEILKDNVEKVLNGVKPLLYNMLRCPRIDKTLTTRQLAQTLQGWINNQNIVGFSRLSSGAYQVALNTDLSNPVTYEQEITSYMDKAQNFIRNNEPHTVSVSQDGQTVFYNYESVEAEAILALSQSGNITLKSYTIRS